MGIDLQNTGRREYRIGMHVMVRRTDRLLPPRNPAARELADLHLGLGIERDAECFRVARGLRVDLPQMVEDGVGFGKFF